MFSLKYYIATIIIALLLSSPLSFAGKLYKWVDEDGNIQYSDSLPPEQVQKSHNELTNSGLTKISVKKAKSQDEILKEQRLQESREKQRIADERKVRKQASLDRVILDTYLTENDITRLRDDKVATLEGTIQLTARNLAQLNKNMASLKKDMALFTEGSNNRQRTAMAIEKKAKQILLFETFIKRKRNEQHVIRDKYEQDLIRFKQIKSRK